MVEISLTLNTAGLIALPVFLAAFFYLSFALGRLYEHKSQQEGGSLGVD